MEKRKLKDISFKLDIIEKIAVKGNYSKKEIKTLKELSNDMDEIVRVNACESLSNNISIDVLNLLKEKACKDNSSLVRGYSAISIANIARRKNDAKIELIKLLKSRLNKEKIIWVKINIYCALYLLGEEKYLYLIIKELNNRLYRNRCAAVNLLAYIISNENKRIIIKSLDERLNIETTIAVRSSINNVLKEI
jgi:HEAT repeat protein